MKNSQRGFAPLIILVIIAVAGIGGGTYVVVTNKEKAKIKTDINTGVDIHASSSVKNTKSDSAPPTTTINDSVSGNASIDFNSIKVTYPNHWENFFGDNDTGSTLFFNYNTKTEISFNWSKFFCSEGLSTCIIAEFTLDPKTTIYNGDGDERLFAVKEKGFKTSSYTFVEGGSTKIKTPIAFYKENTSGDIVGLFASNEDVFTFRFKGTDVNFAKQFIGKIDF